MWLPSLFRPRASVPSRPARFRPGVERLEDRTLLTAGALDATFGAGGKVVTNVGEHDFANGLAVQADGKIVVVGNTGRGIAVARYNPDGTPDTDFDEDGLVTRFGADLNESLHAGTVFLQADGKIVVVGTVTSEDISSFALWRYNPDGSFDTSVLTAFEMQHGAVAVAAATQADGRIVVGGTDGCVSGDPSCMPGFDLALARYNADLTLDTSLDGDGRLIAPLSFDVRDVALQADGKIVVAGDDFLGGGPDANFSVARFNSDGTLDTGFHQDGVVTTDMGSHFDQVVGVAVQPDGKIVVAGSTDQRDNMGRDFALVRYNPNGDLDVTFGKAGKVTTDFDRGEAARAMALQADGKIVVAGTVPDVFGRTDFALARYNGDGTLDTDFGGDGLVATDFGGGSDFTSAVALQADGKIVVAGSTVGPSGSFFDFALARYEGLSQRDVAVNKVVEIISDVQGLVAAGALSNGQGNGLLAKLQAAIQQTNSGQTATAVNQLNAFINQVNDFVGEGILTPAQGQLLIDKANEAITLLAGDPLLAATSPPENAGSSEPLTQAALKLLFAEAIARWQAAGVDTSGLTDVHIQITDLPGALLGVAAGGTIFIDLDAGGWGWFVDPTPHDDSEFLLAGDQGEQNRMDLLTVVMHELGHVLGFDHDEEGLMAETLAPGTRLLPTSEEGSPDGSPSPGPLAGFGEAAPPSVRALDRLFAAVGEDSLPDWDAVAAAILVGNDTTRKR